MADFHEKYTPGRYQALSVNYQTGAVELKDITGSYKHVNFHSLYTVRLKSGQQVTVTDNHSVMTIGEDGNIATAVPSTLKRALVPRRLVMEREEITFDLSGYPVSTRYPFHRLKLTPSLAKLMGLYTAEGFVDGSTLYLALFDRELEQEARTLLRQVHPKFSARLRKYRGKTRVLACNVGRRFAAFLADKCGRRAENKRIPSEIYFAGPEVVRAFLDGYLSGDGTVGANRVTATTVSKELRDGLQLLFCKLGLPVSLRSALPQTQFASARERHLVALGGYYSAGIEISGSKSEQLYLASQTPGEQTPYDYEYLRPLIKEVYGVHCQNALHYRLSPEYLEQIAADLEGRLLSGEEETLLKNLTDRQFWLDCLAKALPGIETTGKAHLRKKLRAGKLTRFSKYLPIFFPYKDMLARFFLPETVDPETGSRIKNNCRSPQLVAAWAKQVLRQNRKMRHLRETILRALQLWPMQVKELRKAPHEKYVYDISVADNENFLTAEGIFVHNSRAGAQVPFSSLNLGTDTTEEGRLVTRAVLEAFKRGLGRGESPIFPNLVFRVKKGINFDPGDPNYDLYRLALEVAARRMNPTFSFMDSSFNRSYGDEVSYMGCRTRVIANRHGEEVSARRGNIAFVTINLPRVALESRGNGDTFFLNLDRVLRLAARQLLHRYEVLSRLQKKDLPFLMGEHLYMGSEKLGPEDSIREVIKHGTLAIGFIGLCETLNALIGKHHGEDEEALQLGLRIIEHIRRRTDQYAEEYDLNFVVLATPAEGLAGRFVAMDRERFGLLPGVTDKDYYTNSFHIPVNYAITMHDKIAREGQFHRLCNAGHISYVELEAPPLHNLEAVDRIVRHMAESDVGYGGINFPVDECRSCAFSGVFPGECPRCGSTDIRRIRRITGYLTTNDRFNSAKRSELRDRRPHFMAGCRK
ncbi:MAG: anaerobic ribonucleoside-triphosphate reductase [Firmicutes bacterium]|nr:anaerobic ribonucleoside-triphosphate reductase [Bacillota bacterium]